MYYLTTGELSSCTPSATYQRCHRTHTNPPPIIQKTLLHTLSFETKPNETRQTEQTLTHPLLTPSPHYLPTILLSLSLSLSLIILMALDHLLLLNQIRRLFH